MKPARKGEKKKKERACFPLGRGNTPGLEKGKKKSINDANPSGEGGERKCQATNEDWENQQEEFVSLRGGGKSFEA